MAGSSILVNEATWASVPAMLRDARVLWRKDGIVSYRLPGPANEVPIAVIVHVVAVELAELEAILSLSTQHYKSFRLIFTCREGLHEKLDKAVHAYAHTLPDFIICRSDDTATRADLLRSAFEHVHEPYFCWLDPRDMFVPSALAVVASAIHDSEADYYYSDRFYMNSNKWACLQIQLNGYQPRAWTAPVFPFGPLAVIKTATVRKSGGLKTMGISTWDIDWLLAYQLLSGGNQLVHIPATLYFEHASEYGMLRAFVDNEARQKLLQTMRPKEPNGA